MSSSTERLRDPVCLMWVPPGQYPLEHQGIHYAFCSEQCRERFLATPGLYVSAGVYHGAAKQQGRQILRRRRWPLAAAPSSSQVRRLEEALTSMMGIEGVYVFDATVTVDYDLLQATARQIETRIAEMGLSLGSSFWHRLYRVWVHYLEDTQAANLADGGGPSGHHH